MLKHLRDRLAVLLEERKDRRSAVDAALATATAEARTALNPAEQSAFDEARASVVAIDSEIDELRSRIADAEADERREADIAALAVATGAPEARSRGGAVVTHEPGVYRKGGQESYFRDLVAVSLNREGSHRAAERMQRNRQEFDVEQRALSTGDSAGGDFVPPTWMLDEYVELARAGRPLADRVRNMPLPGGTDSISVPKIATGTAVAEQASQNTAVQQTDATTGKVTADVTTLAGGQVVAVQLIEQSPINMDDILLADLAADYAVKVDLFVIANNATNKKGLLAESGTNAVTYTDASFTVGELYPKLADALQQIYGGRFLPADTIAMHPRRWAAILGAVDTAGRPLVIPGSGQGAQNAIATTNGSPGGGVVGSILGVDVIADPNIPINLGTGTNEDRIIAMRAVDSILWEGNPRSEAFRETKAAELSVFLRFYNYVAFSAARAPKSVSVIAGTGLTTPTF